MKNLKKVLALVLACVMVFGTVAMAGSVYPDVADDANYAEAVKTLSALNIIKGDENGNFNPDATITRAEMTKILCTMLGTGELSATATAFTDVAADHWASGYIAYAKGLGIVDGYDATTFGPEDPVTYEQVIKLVVAALGYTPVANENGGYPTGYLYVAADKEINKGATGNGSEAAKRSVVAIIVNNAMNTPVMERTSYGSDEAWESLDGTGTKQFKTLLTSKHSTYKVEGVITNSYKNDTALKDGYVDTKITKTLNIDVENKLGATGNGTALVASTAWTLKNVDATGTDAAEYIGYTSNIYFQENDNDDIVVICVVPKSAKNKSIVIDDVDNVYDPSEDTSVKAADVPQVVVASGAVTKVIFSYWNDRDEDTRITTVDLDPNATVYVNNGKGASLGLTATSGVTDILNAIVPDRGEIVLVDTDNDGDYDLIKVTEYQIAIVESVNPNTNRINFKSERTSSKGSITLSTDTNKNLAEWTITLDGAAIEVKDLQEFDVLNIVTNDWDDPTYFTIDATRKVIEGSVEKVSNVDDYVVIGGEKYEIADTLTALPELEDEGKFYLDSKGNIALADTTSVVSGNYAYLYKTGDGTFSEMYVRMFTKDGADVNYELADKVKVNKVYKDSITTAYTAADVDKIFGDGTETATTAMKVSDVFDSSSTSALTPRSLIENLIAETPLKAAYAISGNVSVDRFVTYKVDSNSKITEISLATKGSAIDEFGFVGKTTSSVEWQASLNKFKTSKSIPDNAVIFFVEPTKTIDDYSVKTVSGLVDGNFYTPYYFSNTDEGPAAILMLAIDSSIGDTLATFVEYSKGKADYDDVYNVTYWENGAKVETEMVVNDSVTVTGARTAFTDMQRGDVFVYSVDQDGRVDKISVIFTPGTTAIDSFVTGTGLTMANYENYINIATDINSKFMKLDASGDADSEVWFGAVGKVASTSNGVRLTLLTNSGKFDDAKAIVVPSTAVVTLYNAAMPDAKKLTAGTTSDITASFFSKDANGDINKASTEADDMRYAFVRVYKDVVTDVMFVQYSRD